MYTHLYNPEKNSNILQDVYFVFFRDFRAGVFINLQLAFVILSIVF